MNDYELDALVDIALDLNRTEGLREALLEAHRIGYEYARNQDEMELIGLAEVIGKNRVALVASKIRRLKP